MPPRKVRAPALDADTPRAASAHDELAALRRQTADIETRLRVVEELTTILLDPPWARRKDRMPPKVIA